MVVCNVPKIPYVYTDSLNHKHVSWQIVGETIVDKDFTPLLSGTTLIALHTEKTLSAIVLKNQKFYRILLSYDRYIGDSIMEDIRNYPPKTLIRDQYLIPLAVLNIEIEEDGNIGYRVRDILYAEFVIRNIKGYHCTGDCNLELFEYNPIKCKWIVYECVMMPHTLDLVINNLNKIGITEGISIDKDFLSCYSWKK